jgi:hypothetical protein
MLYHYHPYLALRGDHKKHDTFCCSIVNLGINYTIILTRFKYNAWMDFLFLDFLTHQFKESVETNWLFPDAQGLRPTTSLDIIAATHNWITINTFALHLQTYEHNLVYELLTCSSLVLGISIVVLVVFCAVVHLIALVPHWNTTVHWLKGIFSSVLILSTLWLSRQFREICFGEKWKSPKFA